MYCKRVLFVMFLSGILYFSAWSAFSTQKWMVDGTQSDTPWQMISAYKGRQQFFSDQPSKLLKIHKERNPHNKWFLYVIDYNKLMLDDLISVQQLHMEANRLSDFYMKNRTYSNLNNSRRKREAANQQMESLLKDLESNKQIILFRRSGSSVNLFHFDKKIIVAIEVVQNGKYVNMWIRLSDVSEQCGSWVLK